MVLLQLFIASAISAGTALAVPLAGPPASTSNFNASCTNFSLGTGLQGTANMLSATCYSDKATKVNSTLDLSQCLGIDYTTAHLAWSHLGKYAQYCSSCSLVETTFSCTCSNDGITANSTKDLSENIGNQNGNLVCDI